MTFKRPVSLVFVAIGILSLSVLRGCSSNDAKSAASGTPGSATGVSAGNGDPMVCARAAQDDTRCAPHGSNTQAFHCPAFTDPEVVGLGPACISLDASGMVNEAAGGTFCCPDAPIVDSCQRWPDLDQLCHHDNPTSHQRFNCWWHDPPDSNYCCVNGINTSCCPPPPAQGCIRGGESCNARLTKCQLIWCCP